MLQIVTIILNLILANQQDDALAKAMMFMSAGIATIVLVGCFVIKAIALYRMACKRNMKNKWLAFIPYANYHLMGKLAGPVRMFRVTVKNMGLVVAIINVVIDALVIANNVVYYQLLPFAPTFDNAPSSLIMMNMVLSLISSIISLVSFLAIYGLTYALFGKYCPTRRFWYTFATVLFPVVLPFLLLSVMNKKPYDNYDDYYKEQMAMRFGQNYDPYNNPYNTRENPYNTNNNGKTQQEDPFADYSNNNNYNDNSNNNNGSNGNNGNDNPFDEY